MVQGSPASEPSWIVFRIFRVTLSAVLSAALAVAMLPSPARAWGNNGHIYINQAAADRIPADMPPFMHSPAAIARIAYLGPEPDRWRGASEYALNQAQAPDHFIDLERLEGMGELPAGRYEYIKLLYAKRAGAKNDADNFLPEKVGFQPYITAEVYDRLKEAFRDYRALKKAGQPSDAVEQDVIFYAGWLGHYVGDGSMPLHTSVQYDGWTGPNPHGYTTQKGIHARFENEFVDRNITEASFAGMLHAPSKLNADPFRDYMNYLEGSHKLVERVYEIDKAHGFDGAGSAEGLQLVKRQLAAGAQELLDLWYTAWEASAQ